MIMVIGILFVFIELKVKYDRSFIFVGITLLFLGMFLSVDFWFLPYFKEIGNTQLYFFNFNFQHIIVCMLIPFQIKYILMLTKTASKLHLRTHVFLSSLFGVLFVSGKMGEMGDDFIVYTNIIYDFFFSSYIIYIFFFFIVLLIKSLNNALAFDRKIILYHIAGISLLFISGIADLLVVVLRTNPDLPSFAIFGVSIFGLLITWVFSEKFVQLRLEKSLAIQKLDIESSQKQKIQDMYTKLSQSERMRELLSSMILHDIKNLDAVIEANLRIIKNKTKNIPDAQYHANIATQGCTEIISMASNLLDVNKIDEGKLEINRTRITSARLVDVIKQTANGYLLDEMELDFELVPPDKKFEICWDAYLLKRVVQNLLNNAFKYTPKGGNIKVLFSFDNSQPTLSIFNSGSPIPEDKKDLIFERYYKVEKGSSHYSKGLGLFFCKMVVEEHRDKIWVESSEKGNFFRINFNGNENTTTI